jgi:hypothetical protein
MILGGFLLALISRGLQAMAAKDDQRLEEASSNFEAEDIVPLFTRIAKLIDRGFGEKQIEEVRVLASSLAVEEEKTLVFKIRSDRTKTVLSVTILMSDVDSPDVTIRTSPRLAQRIQEAMVAFQNERDR